MSLDGTDGVGQTSAGQQKEESTHTLDELVTSMTQAFHQKWYRAHAQHEEWGLQLKRIEDKYHEEGTGFRNSVTRGRTSWRVQAKQPHNRCWVGYCLEPLYAAYLLNYKNI